MALKCLRDSTMTSKTNKSRQAEFKKRMRAAGFALVALWIPSHLKAKYKKLSDKDREDFK